MSSYAAFADFYDSLMIDVDYGRYADRVLELLRQNGHTPGLTLDLACGTGSLTLALADRGVDVFGLDGSPEMLSAARKKAEAKGKELLFVCQEMPEIELYSTVDTVVCAMDSISHIVEEQDVRDTFSAVAHYLSPGGYFLFDVNTVYKHREVLGDNTFVLENDDVFCVWQNDYDEKDHTVEITLDFFTEDGGVYTRQTEAFLERAYPKEALRSMLEAAGLSVISVYDGLTEKAPSEETERLLIVAKKPTA